MMTAASALQWEVRRALRFRVWLTFCGLLMVAGCTLLPIIGQQYRGYYEWSPERWRTSPDVHRSITAINLGICLLGIGRAVGMSARQYSLPISSRILATVRLLPGAAWCTALYLILCTLFNTFTAAQWPYLGPALTYGVSYMLMYATVYRFRGNDNRIGLAGLLMCGVILLWIYGHYPPREAWDKPLKPWIDPSITELLVLGLAGILSWLSLVDAIERDRHGRGWGRVISKAAVDSMSAIRQGRAARKFWSAFSAMFWLQWKQDGWLVPCVVTGITAFLAVVNITLIIGYPEFRRDNLNHEAELAALTFALIPVCAGSPWFASLLTSPGKRAVSQQVWPTSESTLPLSDTALGWAVMARCLASSIMSLIGALAIVAVWAGTVELLRRSYGIVFVGFPLINKLYSSFMLNVATYVGNMAFVGWMAASVATATVLSGRRWIASIPLAMIPLVLLPAFINSGRVNSEIGWAVGQMTLATLIFGMVAAYLMAMTRGLLGVRSILAGIVLLITANGIGANLWYLAEEASRGLRHTSTPTYYFVMLMQLLSLAAAAPAIIPLATYANRHR